MELYSKRKTDEEYVEFTRKLIKRSKWYGLFFACGAVLFLVMFEALWRLIHSDKQIMTDISPGIHIGIMLGAMGGFFVVMAWQNMMWAAKYFTGQRAERLMVKFHDEMKKEKDASNHTPALPGPPTGRNRVAPEKK